MLPEFEQHLYENYPLIFSKKCELSVNSGWFDILDRLCHHIQGHINSVADSRKWAIKWNEQVNDPEHEWTAFVAREEREVPELVEQVVAVQIKEKFGTLRFYYDGGDSYIRGLVSMAESMSGVICEDCGKPGKTGGKGWIRTTCEEHTKQ